MTKQNISTLLIEKATIKTHQKSRQLIEWQAQLKEKVTLTTDRKTDN